MCTNNLFSEDGLIGLLELAVIQLMEVTILVSYVYIRALISYVAS